jgi:hypothetical protein
MADQTTFLPEPITADPAAALPKAVCRGCGAAMVWCSSTKGGTVPLDPRPVSDGNLVFEPGAEMPTVRYLRRGDIVPAGTARYRSHFATCPEAQQFRRAV